ncbi:thioesterase domain-containing protein [Kitasatospora kifunensis]|uniref:Thioesterase domain-containing protein n=1 Tax=Kitasatospora kifunensis TaxID=58351 RepID=A0A7W7R122_KITKI|nr:thioesterase domain-containing protein [Kitasatospora kifunensis]MBB4923470.1 thioesterase domain-containing protein [Kitasatospora kifunensis]
MTGQDAGGQPLFLVHPVGGSVNAYRALAKCLAGTYAVTAIEAFGITDGEPVDELPEIVERYTAAVRDAQPDGPYRLAGWSMGGVVAFEMTRELERLGAKVEFTALMDSPFHFPWAEPGIADGAGTPQLRIYFAEDVASSLGWDLPPSAEADPLGWLADTVAGGKQGKYLQLVREDLERRYTVFRAHFHAVESYRPSGPVDAELRLLYPDGSGIPDAPARWVEMTRTGARQGVVEGDHHSFLKAPVVSQVASFLDGSGS